MRAKPGWGSRLRVVLAVVAALALVVVLVIAAVAADIISAYGRNLPTVGKLGGVDPTTTTRIYARNGQLLARVYDQNRVYVPITVIPDVMKKAIVASEDERFFEHRGVDARAVLRAALANYRHERIEQGASTITQQLARASFLTPEPTITRKIQEALLALEIERTFTKDEILERYLNAIYFGAGAYGVQAASHAYFGKDVGKLTLGEAAMLAGVVAAPSVYSPYADPDRAEQRQRRTLARMQSSGWITPDEAEAAAAEPLHYSGVQNTGVLSYRYPYFTTYVIHELETKFGKDAVLHGGLSVFTTLDPKLQDLAQEAVTTMVAQGAAEGYGMHEGALVAENPHSGEILAMVGGTGFSASNQFNRAWQAHRQPGSAFKPYVYSAAFDMGVPVTTVIADAPVSYPAGDGTIYSPMDDDGRFLGAITLRRALALSRNIVAVKLADRIGIDNVVEYAHKMGITEDLDPYLSTALGAGVVSPLSMVSGFSTIADGGVYTPPTAIKLVEDKFGSTIFDGRFPDRSVALSTGAAYIMTSVMQDVIKYGTGHPNADIGRPAAGKTGTTSSYRDAWFVGFVPTFAAATWVGNDDYSRMNVSYGGNIPARMWSRFMHAALAGTKPVDFPSPPPDLEVVRVCSNEKRYPPGAKYGTAEYFLVGTAPLVFCGMSLPGEAAPKPKASPRKAASATPQPQPTEELPIETPPAVPPAAPASSASPAPPGPVATASGGLH